MAAGEAIHGRGQRNDKQTHRVGDVAQRDGNDMEEAVTISGQPRPAMAGNKTSRPKHFCHHRWRRRGSNVFTMACVALTLLLANLHTAHAALFYPSPDLNYNKSVYNCLGPEYHNSDSRGPQVLLQFVPYAITAVFNASSPAYTLNVTVYGNVTGQQNLGDRLRPPNDTAYWRNASETFGKIPDQDLATGLQSTLFTRVNVLNYVPYKSDSLRFCNNTLNTPCPIAPVFEQK